MCFGVLVFVDQYMAQRLLPLISYLGVLRQKFERQTDQVVKVHALVSGQALFIARHDARNHTGVVVGGLSFGLRRVQPLVFPEADGPLPLAGGGGVGGAPAVLEDADHIICVQNAELRFEAERSTIFAHDAHTQGVEGADHHVLGRLADQSAGTLAHFCGGFVGEGDGCDLLGFEPHLDQALDLVRDHPGLA
jgi:hypothetical protein